METVVQPGTQVPIEELVRLCAVDNELFGRSFFPETFRSESPPFAASLWEPLENPLVRLVNIIAFRDSSKTTRLRTFAAKRIAYGVSRTVLYIGASEKDAIRSVQWLRGKIERNRLFASAFNLRQGRKWEETQIEIRHETFGHTVWVLGAGITGSLRGINFDDYRPDLIIVDDPQTDETAATEEQRDKLADLILGTVKNSLAPATDEPNAKLAMAITPQHASDISQLALRDPEWTSRVFPCWTQETMDLPVDQQMSSWEARHSTTTLRNEKKGAIRRNKLSIFTREKECRLISKEKAQFLPTWLNIRQTGIKPRGCFSVLAIDPLSPPSERELAKGLRGKDWEAHYVWGRHNGQYHLLDFARNQGHNPDWSVSTAFGFMRQYRCVRCVFDAVAYQRTLKFIFQEEMKRRRFFFSVVPIADGMKKFARITGTLTGLATNGLLWIGEEHTVFAEQFEAYPDVEHDDDLDASALALQDLSNPYLEDLSGNLLKDDSEIEPFDLAMGCP